MAEVCTEHQRWGWKQCLGPEAHSRPPAAPVIDHKTLRERDQQACAGSRAGKNTASFLPMLVSKSKLALAKSVTPSPPVKPSTWVTRICVICTGAPALSSHLGPPSGPSGLVLFQGAVGDPLGFHPLPQGPLPPAPDSCLISLSCSSILHHPHTPLGVQLDRRALGLRTLRSPALQCPWLLSAHRPSPSS